VGEAADLEGGCGGATEEEATAVGERRQPREVGAIRVGEREGARGISRRRGFWDGGPKRVATGPFDAGSGPPHPLRRATWTGSQRRSLIFSPNLI
jgi:hypothetical protein